MEAYDAVDVITAKRDGKVLTPDQIDWVVDAYTRSVVTEEQMSALAMAIYLKGMQFEEIARFTRAMMNSGTRLSYPGLSQPTVDKHSTGGVGDKITLILAPLVACFGIAVPQLSGRGLGHTGGTLDKLESIPGWKAELSTEAMHKQLQSVGAVICAAGPGLAPADKKLYALRDTTGTVDCIPLIASSIMSKKIAEGTDVLVLDVKVGTGAFMKDFSDAHKLAKTMVALGTNAGVKTSALITEMSTPLGRTVGNALEVREAVEVLGGGGPSDVVELTVALAQEMVNQSGQKGYDVRAALRDGRAMDKWEEMIRAQGGDPDAALPKAKENHVVRASRSGVVTDLDAMHVGIASWRLGAGRAALGATVQAGAGIEIHTHQGDSVEAGQPMFTLHSDQPERFARAEDMLLSGVKIDGFVSPGRGKVVLERVS